MYIWCRCGEGFSTPAAEIMAGRNIQHHNWKQSAAVLDMSGVAAGSKVSTDQETREVQMEEVRARRCDGRITHRRVT